MSNIRSIITEYRQNMINAGLLREAGAVQLSSQVAALRPSLTKISRALTENPDLLRREVQVSPLAMLFEYTLPKMEPVLTELGEARAEKIIRRLCEHAKQIVADHPEKYARQHLEALFSDLAGYEKHILESGGVETIISAYQRMHFEWDFVGYLKLNLPPAKAIFDVDSMMVGDKEFDNIGMIDICFNIGVSLTEMDIACLRRVKGLQALHFVGSAIKDKWLNHLSGLINLRELTLVGAGLSGEGLKSLSGLANLQSLSLSDNSISEGSLESLSGLPDLHKLELDSTPIGNGGLVHLTRITRLRTLDLSGTKINKDGLPLLYPLKELSELNVNRTELSVRGNANAKALKRLRGAIPGLEINR